MSYLFRDVDRPEDHVMHTCVLSRLVRFVHKIRTLGLTRT